MVMNEEVRAAFAKLAGVLKGAKALLTLSWNRGTKHAALYEQFDPIDAGSYFTQAERQVTLLREKLPALYGDYPTVDWSPKVEMGAPGSGKLFHARNQVEALVRYIDQIFEIHANSQISLSEPAKQQRRVFLTHGTALDWREVQSFIERDLKIDTLELAQEPNLGRTILEKLEQESAKCDYAVIVMTGDDADATGGARARQNVIHEIGYFQARYGLSRVCLLHEDGTNIMSNIHGLVYIPFTKGNVAMTFGHLMRELKAAYGL